MNIEEYLNSWNDFKIYCENKPKGRCILNNFSWRKLLEFHLENFLKNQENPYMFLLITKWKFNNIFCNHKMNKFYNLYSRERCDINKTEGLIEFPDWRKGNKDK